MSEPDSKAILVNTIKEWIALNSEITQLQKTMREFKAKKKLLTTSLVSVMENNEIDRFDTKNGRLMYKKTKVKAPINRDYLLKMLDDYFKNDPDVDTNEIGTFILENRPIRENSSLVIKENK